MSRLQGVCPGDCSRCELLAGGEVDMVPCVLDQIFQRVRKAESAIAVLSGILTAKEKIVFTSVETVNEEVTDVQTDD